MDEKHILYEPAAVLYISILEYASYYTRTPSILRATLQWDRPRPRTVEAVECAELPWALSLCD